MIVRLNGNGEPPKKGFQIMIFGLFFREMGLFMMQITKVPNTLSMKAVPYCLPLTFSTLQSTIPNLRYLLLMFILIF